jgi:tetratricopeptide (TPR) repeat protein
MPERPYMVIDWRADHSLRVPRPDLTLEIGVPNACSQSGCHDDKPDTWSAEKYREWYGKARKPHYGTILAAGRDHDPRARDPLIRLAGDDLYPTIVRATALQLLGAYPGEESTAAFNQALSDPEALLRFTAVTSVNTGNPEEFVELVSPLLFDPVRGVRMQAASRLAGLPRQLFKPYQQEAFDDALAEYVTAMEYSLDFAFAGHNLGNLYAQLGDPQRAETYYRAALEIDDLFYPAKANLAVLLNSQGRNEEAERLLRQIVESYPERYDASYSLGLLLAEMGRDEEAAEQLRLAAEGMPERPRIFYNLGLILQQLGRTAEAEAALRRTVELEPTNLDYLYALADHYAKRGEYRQALRIAERMIASHPDQPIGRQIKDIAERALRSTGPE